MEKANPKKETAKTADEIINEVYDKYAAEADAKLFGGKKMPEPKPETAPEAPSRADAEKEEPSPKPEPEKKEDKTTLAEAFGKINQQNEKLKEELIAKNKEKNLSDAFKDINVQNRELEKNLEARARVEEKPKENGNIQPEKSSKTPETGKTVEIDKRSLEAKKIDELMGKAFDLDEESAKKEKISISEKERDERLLELGKELEAARREYIIRDYNLDKNSGIFKKLFGFGKRSQLGEFNREYETAKSRYEEVLKKFKDATAEGLVSDRQEAEITANWLEKGEFIELQKTRDQIKLENAPWSQGIKNGCMKLIDKYRKLPTWKKIAIGFGVAGVASAGGAAGIGAAAALGVGWRIFTSGVSAIGFKGMYEGVAEGYRNKKAKSNTEENLNKYFNKKSEFDPQEFKKRLDDKIKTVDREIQKRKAWGKFRSWLAVGTAAAVFFGGRYVAQRVMEHFHGGGTGSDKSIDDYIRSRVAGHEGSGGSPPPSGAGQGLGYHEFKDTFGMGGKGGAFIPESTEFPQGEIPPIDLEVPKSSSLEGTIIKYLENQGMNHAEAGNKAHLIALEYAKNMGLEKGPYSLIHPGAHIEMEMGTDGQYHIDNISGDEKLGWLAEKNIESSAHDLHYNEAEIFKKPELELSEESRKIMDSLQKGVEYGTDTAAADIVPIPLEKIHATAYELRSGITNADKNLWDSVADKNLWDSIADKDLWDSVKNMTYEGIHNQSDPRLAGVNHKLDEMRVQYAEKFGRDAEPMSGETLAQYTERLARLNNGSPLQSAVEIINSPSSGSSIVGEDSFPAGSSADADFQKFSSDAHQTMEKFKSDANDKLERMKRSF